MWKTTGRTGVGVLALATGLACAGEWQAEPWARANLDVNDNIRFTATNPEQSTGVVLEVGGKFRNDTEAVRTSLTPKLVFRRYDSSANVDSNDQYLTFSTRLLQERGEVGVTAEVVRNTTLTSELTDTGIVSGNQRHVSYRIAPSYSYALSERDSLQLGVGYDAVRYDGGSGSGLLDYDNSSANLGYRRRFSEILDGNASVGYSHYEAKDVDSQSDTVTVQLGVNRRLSERTAVGGSIGGYQTDSRFFGVDVSRSGGTASLNLQHHTELTTLSAALSRNVNPSGGGEVLQNTSLTLAANRRLTEKLSLGLSAVAQRNRSLGSGDQLDRDYYSLRPSFSWHLARQWYLTGQYSYSRQKYDASNSTAEANAVSVGVEYRPRQLSLY